VEGPAVHPERSDAAASASRRRKAPVPVSIPGSTATRTASSHEIPARNAGIHLERGDAAPPTSPGRRAATSPGPARVPPEHGHIATTPWRSREAPTSTAGATVHPERSDATSVASWSRRAPDVRSGARSEIATGASQASSVPAPGTARPEAPPAAFRGRAVAIAVAGLVFVAAGLAVILALTGGRDVRPARSGSPERAAGELRARAPQAAIASPVLTPAPSIAPSPPSVAARAPSVAAPPAPVTPPRAPDTAPLRTGDRYEVVGGDTLWSISRRMLGDPYAWPDIHAANREAVRDPDLIRPGQRLVVPARTPAPRAAP